MKTAAADQDMWTAIGLMSGTSMDGIDIALVRSDGKNRLERGPFLGVAYEADFRKQLEAALPLAADIDERTQRPGNLADLERELTDRHHQAVERFLDHHAIARDEIDLVGFHGQTVVHRPEQALSVQLGDGQRLADSLRLPVVFDMRANDMAQGGQGAPLAPAYHAVLAKSLYEDPAQVEPVMFVNIGGISNITFVGKDGRLVAFDAGPGNTLIDRFVSAHAGIPFDQDGAIASEGRMIETLAERYLGHAFFTAPERHSLDRNDFTPPEPGDAGLEDGARTLAYVTAAAIAKAVPHLPARPSRWIICGGGRLNRIIMDDLARLAAPVMARVETAEQAGLNGDAMEAEAWAYLAIRAVNGLPLTWPETTGVTSAQCGGRLARPSGCDRQF